MLRNSDFARFVTSLLPNALNEQGRVHRTLLAFNAATLNEFIKRSKKMDEGTGVMLVTSLLEPLQVKGREPSKEAIVSSRATTIDSFTEVVNSWAVTSSLQLCRKSAAWHRRW